ncbi:Uncharacterized protein dnm_041340 [Desulfonema magnum]|uniref:Uncharacterized protein n=1 Tax=Desulfonema magnum TaxID=45655 RepID=A0A975GPN8_9BACT|nr:Uncharacterized protein dnm_041340 [Desulfonema magnum]
MLICFPCTFRTAGGTVCCHSGPPVSKIRQNQTFFTSPAARQPWWQCFKSSPVYILHGTLTVF